jgi:phage-related protein
MRSWLDKGRGAALLPHYYRVMWQGRTYAALPKGEHGKGKRGQKQGRGMVEIGHIRHMVRQLAIDMDCARKHIDLL